MAHRRDSWGSPPHRRPQRGRAHFDQRSNRDRHSPHPSEPYNRRERSRSPRQPRSRSPRYDRDVSRERQTNMDCEPRRVSPARPPTRIRRPSFSPPSLRDWSLHQKFPIIAHRPDKCIICSDYLAHFSIAHGFLDPSLTEAITELYADAIAPVDDLRRQVDELQVEVEVLCRQLRDSTPRRSSTRKRGSSHEALSPSPSRSCTLGPSMGSAHSLPDTPRNKGKDKAARSPFRDRPSPENEDFRMDDGTTASTEGYDTQELATAMVASTRTHQYETIARSRLEPGQESLAGPSRLEDRLTTLPVSLVSRLAPPTLSKRLTGPSLASRLSPAAVPFHPTPGSPTTLPTYDQSSRMTSSSPLGHQHDLGPNGIRGSPISPESWVNLQGVRIPFYTPPKDKWNYSDLGPRTICEMTFHWYRAWANGAPNLVGQLIRWRTNALQLPANRIHAAAYKLIHDLPIPDWFDQLEGPQRNLYDLRLLTDARNNARNEFHHRFGVEAPCTPIPRIARPEVTEADKARAAEAEQQYREWAKRKAKSERVSEERSRTDDCPRSPPRPSGNGTIPAVPSEPHPDRMDVDEVVEERVPISDTQADFFGKPTITGWDSAESNGWDVAPTVSWGTPVPAKSTGLSWHASSFPLIPLYSPLSFLFALFVPSLLGAPHALRDP